MRDGAKPQDAYDTWFTRNETPYRRGDSILWICNDYEGRQTLCGSFPAIPSWARRPDS